MKPDQLGKLGITVTDIINAIQSQNTVNPAGQVGGEPMPKGQEYTYAVRAQGRLISADDFGQIVVRETPDGGVVRVKDVARVELGSQDYSVMGRLNGKPGAIIAVYQLPGSNAVDAANGVKKLIAGMKQTFPQDMDYVISLDTTKAVTSGIKEIVETLLIAIVLVILVVYIFLQSWRATLIPMLAVPVALVGTFIFFPLFGFSINTLSLLGLVLAIGLVVDDAIVVVEGVGRHIEEGLSPKEAALKAMDELTRASSRNRVGALCRVRSNGLYSRNHRPPLSAICGHHRHFRAPFRFQRAYSESGSVGSFASAQEREPRDCWEGFLPGSTDRSRARQTVMYGCPAR